MRQNRGLGNGEAFTKYSTFGSRRTTNQMVISPPTTEQMNQLRSIHNVFKENENADLIIEEENQIHPDIMERLQRIDFIVNGKK